MHVPVIPQPPSGISPRVPTGSYTGSGRLQGCNLDQPEASTQKHSQRPTRNFIQNKLIFIKVCPAPSWAEVMARWTPVGHVVLRVQNLYLLLRDSSPRGQAGHDQRLNSEDETQQRTSVPLINRQQLLSVQLSELGLISAGRRTDTCHSSALRNRARKP